MKFFLSDYPKIKSKYDVAKIIPDVEPLAKMKKERAKLIRRLNKGRKRKKKLLRRLKMGKRKKKLAKKLQRCKKQRRCWSDSCQVCRRLFKRWVASEVLPQLKKQDLLFVTLVPVKRSRPLGELHLFEPLKMKGALSKQFSRPGLKDVVVIGSIDISYNVHTKGLWAPRWQPHFHLIVAGISKKKLRAILKPLYKIDESVSRPTHFKPVTDLPEAVSYAFKTYFSRRNSYIDKHGKTQTESVALKPKEMEEAALFSDTIKTTDRFFRRNVDRFGKRLAIKFNNSVRIIN